MLYFLADIGIKTGISVISNSYQVIKYIFYDRYENKENSKLKKEHNVNNKKLDSVLSEMEKLKMKIKILENENSDFDKDSIDTLGYLDDYNVISITDVKDITHEGKIKKIKRK